MRMRENLIPSQKIFLQDLKSSESKSGRILRYIEKITQYLMVRKNLLYRDFFSIGEKIIDLLEKRQNNGE